MRPSPDLKFELYIVAIHHHCEKSHSLSRYTLFACYTPESSELTLEETLD